MKPDAKTIYAQSSDIKSRSYLEYRKDMKKKAIAELEVLEWLNKKFKKLYHNKKVKISKSGGDKFLWFLREGGISRASDFIGEINNKIIEIEFQYAEKENLDFYDFKISKVVKKVEKKKVPIKNKLFVYIHKPSFRFAIFTPKWILKNGKIGEVPAWRTPAYRVPKEKFETLLKEDNDLKKLCRIIDMKNYILDFQHKLIEIYKENLSCLLQSVIDEEKIVRIIPKDLDSFFKICFILENTNKLPKNINLWLIYLLTFINEKLDLEKISKIVYSLDFLYMHTKLQQNELSEMIKKTKIVLNKIKSFSQKDGSFTSSYKVSPLEETRYALFSINLIEDIIQDCLFYYKIVEFNPITKIYQTVPDLEKTYKFVTNT